MTRRTLRSLIFIAVIALPPLAFVPEAEAQSQCRYLEMRLMQLRAGGHDGPEMQSVKQMLSVAGCSGYQQFVPRETRARSGPNTVRTLCVRACDGYYFPISFSTTEEHLADDAAICRQRCPAADAQLYYHRRSEGPESMISINGTAYTDLATAFLYRTTLDPSCTCGTPLMTADPLAVSSTGLFTSAGSNAVANPAAFILPKSELGRPSTRTAEARADAGADPETLMNRAGGLSPASPEAQARALDDADPVRVILPGWNAALRSSVLLTPVPN